MRACVCVCVCVCVHVCVFTHRGLFMHRYILSEYSLNWVWCLHCCCSFVSSLQSLSPESEVNSCWALFVCLWAVCSHWDYSEQLLSIACEQFAVIETRVNSCWVFCLFVSSLQSLRLEWTVAEHCLSLCEQFAVAETRMNSYRALFFVTVSSLQSLRLEETVAEHYFLFVSSLQSLRLESEEVLSLFRDNLDLMKRCVDNTTQYRPTQIYPSVSVSPYIPANTGLSQWQDSTIQYFLGQSVSPVFYLLICVSSQDNTIQYFICQSMSSHNTTQ